MSNATSTAPAKSFSIELNEIELTEYFPSYPRSFTHLAYDVFSGPTFTLIFRSDILVKNSCWLKVPPKSNPVATLSLVVADSWSKKAFRLSLIGSGAQDANDHDKMMKTAVLIYLIQCYPCRLESTSIRTSATLSCPDSLLWQLCCGERTLASYSTFSELADCFHRRFPTVIISPSSRYEAPNFGRHLDNFWL